MPITKDADLEKLRVGMRGEFKSVLDGAKNEWGQIASVIPSTTGTNAYGWMGDNPHLREWVGDRVVKNVKEHGHTVVNKKYESTIGINRTDLEDDNLGMYGSIARNQATEVLRFENSNVFQVLKKGDSTLTYDGQNHFDSDHPVYANPDGTGAPTSVSNLLGDTKSKNAPWYLLDTSQAIKPLILQRRTSPELENITDTQQSHVFMKDQYLMGIRYRVAFTAAFWQLSVKSYEDLTAAKFNEAYAAMMGFKGDGGRPLGVRPTVLVVPVSLRVKALQILKAERLDSGATNTNFGAVELMVSAYL